ncbi:MAG: AAA family ATPase [Proteobacteria bacterium]|nr:AAA family ATPase [Pseudomonadota bacterium]
MKPSQVSSALKHLVAKQRPVFVWGPPGAGKSDVVRQVANDLEMNLRDVRLSLLDPIDLKGFPVVDKENDQMAWVPANFLPPMMVKGKNGKMVPNEEHGILFLDEMNSAPQAVQAAAYQLILNRCIGDYVLPKNIAMIAAGNRSGDRAVTHQMPSPLANRFVHIDYDVHMDDWYNWATENNISPMVRAFIRFRPNLLHSFDPKENPRAFPSPRSWTFVNDIVGSNLDSAVEMELIKGTVGEGPMTEYIAFANIAKDLPTVDQILMAPEKTEVPSSPAAKYALCTALDKKATKDNLERVLKYVGRMETEYQVLFLRSVLLNDRALSQTKAFTEWAAKNQAVLM